VVLAERTLKEIGSRVQQRFRAVAGEVVLVVDC
jgi:hypothetical protein